MAITGSGTQGDPYIVHDYTELRELYTFSGDGMKYAKLANDIKYMNNFPPMLGPPTMWGSPTKILLKEMHNSPILLKTQKSQDVQIGDTTIPHQITKRLFEGIDWELI